MTVRGANYPRRPSDDYSTPAYVTRDLVNNYPQLFSHRTFCDPAPGKKVMVRELKRSNIGHLIEVPRGFDFLTDAIKTEEEFDIVTNPPYGGRSASMALDFIKRGLEITEPWQGQVIMLLPFDFDAGKPRLNGKGRRPVFEHPAFAAKIVLPYRIAWFNGQSGSLEHAWYVWQWKNKHPPIIRYMKRPALG